MNLPNLEPHTLFFGTKFINTDKLIDYTVDPVKWFIVFDYGSGLKDVILFATKEELDSAVSKLERVK